MYACVDGECWLHAWSCNLFFRLLSKMQNKKAFDRPMTVELYAYSLPLPILDIPTERRFTRHLGSYF